MSVALLGCAACIAAAPIAAAQEWDAGALHAPTSFSGPPLTLDEAGRLAVAEQPLLRSRAATIAALDEQAVAAAQLPDPRLASGLRDVPVNSGEAFSLRKDNFTEFTVGVSQDVPRAAKRRLRGARAQLAADADRYGLDDDRRAIQRDAALAWLDAYAAEQGLLLTRALSAEAALQVQALEKDYGNGKAAQADWFAARVDAGLAQDQEHDWLHHAQRARAVLARWLGAQDARRPLAALPTAARLSPGRGASIALPEFVALVDRHPVVRASEKQTDVATTDIALAKQSYKPDLTVEGYFAYRQDFADFDAALLPDARRRIDAARQSYAAGRGSFDAVLTARRAALDVQLQRLALAVEWARLRASRALPDTSTTNAYRRIATPSSGPLDCGSTKFRFDAMRHTSSAIVCVRHRRSD